MTTLTIISKPDCHLCDVAREIIEQVTAELPEGAVDIEEFSILDDKALYDQWWEKIPVVLI
ncbi:MAG: glutaredoxin family protein, partial [Rhodococcus sp. (in: high G+C Gram-positive bacteria)]|nr:glutaredoxin family protein [Rhodococcus sp. (in: high G+C Gram-positive bacteria)]